MTFKWNWTGTGTPPSAVTIKVVASAAWTGPPGNCDDGLGQGDPKNDVLNGPGQVISSGQSGTKYVYVKVGTGGSVSLTISPSASAHHGTCSVSITETLYMASLSLTGPVNADTDPKLAIGQLLTATVERGQIPANAGDKYTWSMPSGGSPFGNYTASSTSATYTSLTLPANTATSISCYFAKDAPSATVTCTFHSGTLNVDIPLPRTIRVSAPALDSKRENCGSMKLVVKTQDPATGDTTATDYVAGGSPPNAFWLWGATWTGASGNTYTNGIWLVEKLTDPAFLTAGSGQFGFVQLRSRTSTTNGVPDAPGTGLDAGFPYASTPWVSADGANLAILQDVPGISVASGSLPNSFSYSITATYSSYLMYKPADDVAGASVYVPIRLITWAAKGHCSSSSSGLWTQSDDGSGILSATPLPTFPIWP